MLSAESMQPASSNATWVDLELMYLLTQPGVVPRGSWAWCELCSKYAERTHLESDAHTRRLAWMEDVQNRLNEVARAPGGSYAHGFQDGIMTGYAKGKAEAKGKGPKGDGKGADDNSNKGKGPKAGDNQGKGKGKEKGKEVYYGFEVVDDDRPWV